MVMWILFPLGLVGLAVGAIINLGVYELAYHRRPISPWSPHRPTPAQAFDYLPVWGWWRRRHEAKLFGSGFWIRPMLVELGAAIALPALYWWEVLNRGLDPPWLRSDLVTGHVRFVFHSIMLSLLTVGTLIDIDEKTLPDAITLPGTWLALILAAIFPWILPPISDHRLNGPFDSANWPADAVSARPLQEEYVAFLHLASPGPWPQSLDGYPKIFPLLVGVGCWWLWTFALMDRRWYGRVGLRRAWTYFWARLARAPSTRPLLLIGLSGTVLIGLVWWIGGSRWQALLSALVGLVVAGGLVWVIRLLGSITLQREAMGFGDVTLMGMIGTFLGWQGSLIVFFLAPFLALIVGIVSLVFRGQNIVPFGPFLSMAAALVLVFWQVMWLETSRIFSLGPILPLVLLACLAFLPPLLIAVRAIRELLEGLFGR